MFKKKYIPIPPNGCEPSPPDARDVLASQVSPEVQRYPEICLPPFDLKVLNQGQEPSCVGQSCAVIKQERELLEKISETFDGSWIYNKCKEIDGWGGSGTFLRIGMKVLQKEGAKPLSGTNALKYKIGGYARLDSVSFESLKKAIFINRGIMAGFQGSNQGWQTAYVRPHKTGEATWGHAVALIGYNKTHIIGINSWGETWGDKGYFYVPNTYMPFEAWEVLVDLPTQFLPLESNEGFIALGDWLNIQGLIITTKANTNFRSSSEISNNVIKVVPSGTKLTIQEFVGISNNYYWLRTKVA